MTFVGRSDRRPVAAPRGSGIYPAGEPPDPHRLRRDPRLSSLVLAGYGIAAAALFWQAWVSPGDRMVGVGGDAIQQLWVISWAAHAVSHGALPFYTHLLNYPNGVNLMWDGIPFPLVPAFAVADAIAGPIPAYDFMMTLVLALNAWCGYLACAHWAEHRGAAVLGGFLFGFGPAVVNQALDHPFLAAVFILPLALLCLDHLAVRQSSAPWRWGILLGLLAAAQFYMAEEIWATMAVVSAAGLLWLGCYRRRSVLGRLPHLVEGLGWALLVMTPLVAGPILFQFFGPGAVHGPPLPASFFSGYLLGFVVPTWVTALNVPPLLHLSLFGFYVGLPILALVAVLWLRDRGAPVVGFFMGWTLIIAVLLLGPGLRFVAGPSSLPLPDLLLEHIPFLGYFLPVRLELYLDLGVAIVAALLVDRALRRPPTRLEVLLLVLAVASWFPTVTYPAVAVSTPAFFATTHLPSHRSLLIIPFARNVNSDTAMLWQVQNDFRYPTPDGYFTRVGSNVPHPHGPAPTPFTEDIWMIQTGGAAPPVTPHLRSEASDYLRQHGVAATALGPMLGRSAMRRWLSLVFGRAPTTVGGADIWYSIPP